MNLISPQVAKDIVNLPGFEQHCTQIEQVIHGITNAEIVDTSEGVRAMLFEGISATHSTFHDEHFRNASNSLNAPQKLTAINRMQLGLTQQFLTLLKACADHTLTVRGERGAGIPYETFYQQCKKYEVFADGNRPLLSESGNVKDLSLDEISHFLNSTKELLEKNGKDISFVTAFNDYAARELRDLAPKAMKHTLAYKIFKLPGFEETLAYLEQTVAEARDYSEDIGARQKVMFSLQAIKKMNNDEPLARHEEGYTELGHLAYLGNYLQANKAGDSRGTTAFFDIMNREIARSNGIV